MKKIKELVLIVDDNPVNIDLIERILKTRYNTARAENGYEAIDLATELKPDLILLDIIMPEIDGYEVCMKLKENIYTKDIPIIFITGMDRTGNKARGFKIGAVDYITKPFHPTEVIARVETHVSLKKMSEKLNEKNKNLADSIKEKTSELHNMVNATFQTMSMIVEIRDPYTAGHQQRVAELACSIAKKMNLSDEQINTINLAGTLHDVGKIRVPESIINRSGKLLDMEYQMLKIHPQVSYDIINKVPSKSPVAEIIYQHHERLNGSGYPRGLDNNNILIEAKILAVADVTEAMSSHRPYRPALGIDSALDEIKLKKGILYDSEVVEACRELFIKDKFCFSNKFDSITEVLL